MRGSVSCVAVILGLFVPGAASAKSYCVDLPNTCAPADNRASLESALSAAIDSAGPDQVLLGAGTFTAAFGTGFDYGAADPVEIIGRGPEQTVLTASAGLGSNDAVLSLSGHAGSAVRSLAVSIPATSAPADGLVLSGGTASEVWVSGAPTAQVRRGIVQTGGRVEKSKALAPGSNGGTIGIANTDGVIDGVDAQGATGLILAGTTTTKRFRTSSNATAGISASGAGTHTISQSEIRNGNTYGIYLSSTTGQAQTVNVSDTTISATGTYGVLSSQSSTSSLQMSGVNVVNNSYGVYRLGSAPVTVTYSNVWNNSSANYVGLSAGTGTISQNPQFISSTDLRLQSTSPLIDAGDPNAAAAPLDAAGRTRDVDGNGDGTVRRDIGANEYQRSAPVITASALPADPKPGQTVTFSASVSDPDLDSFVVGWNFSDGVVVSGSTAERVFDQFGTYTGTVTATDSSGRSSSVAVVVTIPAPPVEEQKPVDTTPSEPPPSGGDALPSAPQPSQPVTPLPLPLRDTLAPKLSAVSLPKTVRLGKAAPGPFKKGALRFTLSEAATVKVTFTRAITSRKKTRFVRVPGAITLAGTRGINRIRFVGRLSKSKALKPGKYRMTLTPTDAARNKGVATTRTFILR